MNDKEFLTAISSCVRCGGCKAQCPSFDATSQETHTARGRLKLLKSLAERQVKPGVKLNDKLFSCLMCGNCTVSCPLNIDIDEVFYHARSLLKETDSRHSTLRLLTKLAFKNTDLTLKVIKPFQKILEKKLTDMRLLPHKMGLIENPFKKTEVFRPAEKIGRVAVFSGCSVKHIYPELSYSLAAVLNALKYEVVFPHSEVCCGAPFRSLGMEADAHSYAEKNYEVFSRLKVDAILSLCPTCVVALRKYYPKLIGKELNNVCDISTFLKDKVNTKRKQIKLKATFHDPCHQKNFLKNTTEAREILTQCGADIIEPKRHMCCGFGGTYSFFHKEASERILEATCAQLMRTGCDVVVTSCPNCIFQLSKGLTERPILHLIEVLEESLCTEDVQPAEVFQLDDAVSANPANPEEGESSPPTGHPTIVIDTMKS
ncbi:MAG: (Fe-S)-binding protein [Candidatus Magnetobacterium sp. LHC-1]|nr:(Fe-S)-binding protein [Nitrospirota bacterium]